ncbi:MAG: hypothetical protein ABEJ80_03510 [Halarchaeum sp.]
MQARAVAAAALVVVAALASGAAVGGAGASSASDITRTVSLSLTPGTPGEIGVTSRYDVPDRVTSLTVTVPETVTVVSTRGFSRTSDGYEWDGGTGTPTLSMTSAVNQTYGGSRALDGLHATLPAGVAAGSNASAAADGTGYQFVDVGPWAIAPIPQFSTRWVYRGADVGIDRRVRVDGEGVVGDSMAYLGPSRTYTREANGQTFRLVVPGATSLTESPDAILNALAAASDALRVGNRDPRVTVVAAPTGVGWGPAGIEYGGSDAWVRADRRLDVAADVWVHEYVHTRQDYETARDARWLVEASAEYYAGRLTLDAGRISYRDLRTYLSHGTTDQYANAVLADPSTWDGPANYYKGALVASELDRRVRLGSDHAASFDDVFAALNDASGTVSDADVRAAVADAGGASARDAEARYVTTRAVPDPMSASEYERAFGVTPPTTAYDVRSLAASGPWRNESVADGATLAVGETLSFDATVANTGERAGDYAVTLRRNGTAVANASGTLDAGASEDVSFSHAFDRPGAYSLAFGSHRVDFAVVRPATPVVESVSVNRTRANASEPVAVDVTVANPTSAPARGTYALAVDGSNRTTWTTYLAANETRTRTYVLSFASGGTHTVAVGDRSGSVDVSGGTPIPGVPGFGPAIAALALVLAGALAARRRERQ